MLDSLIEGMVVAGRYRLERRFASGAWGSLWHAHDEKSHLNCTVRLADAGVVDLKAVRERFAREVRAANALRCENVVNVLDEGEWSGMPFVVFESLSGEDLATRLKREGRLPPGQVLEIVSDVAHALTRAHDLGIVHRDLKPENIFLIRVGSNEVAKVLDFGITGGGPGASLDRATKVGHHLGQPLYTSPEQATAGHIDFRSDLWSLAAIAFHCFAGRAPFESQALDDLLTQIASAPIPKITDFDAELPATLDAWRENALARDPEFRFQSAEELADALAHAFQRATLTGHPAPDFKTRERRAARENAPDDLNWLSGIPDASARAADNFSEAPLSRQRAYWWGMVPGARRRALRVSAGAVLGLMVVMLGVALLRNTPSETSMAEATLAPQKPVHSLQTPPAAAEAALEAKPASVLETSSESGPAIEPAETAPLTPPPPEPVPCQAPVAAPAAAAPAAVTVPVRDVAKSVRAKAADETVEAVPARSAPKADAALVNRNGEPDYGI